MFELGLVISFSFQLGLLIIKGGFTKNFGRIFLVVGPAGFIPGFRGKFGVGPDSWYQSIRLSDSSLSMLLPYMLNNT